MKVARSPAAAGFIGGAVVAPAPARAATRSSRSSAIATGRAAPRRRSGAKLVEDDLSDVARLTAALDGADAVIHAAGSYRIGIPKAERGAMWDANVGTTTRVLDAAEAAGDAADRLRLDGQRLRQHPRPGRRRDVPARPRDGFLSWYDETKYGAHEVAEQRIAGGAPIVIVDAEPGLRPGDHSGLGEQLRLAYERHAAVHRRWRDVGIGARPRRRPRGGHRRRARSRPDRPSRTSSPATAIRLGDALDDRGRGSAARRLPAAPDPERPPPGDGAARPAHRPAEPARESSRRRPASPTGRARSARRTSSASRPRDLGDGAPRHVRRRA